MRSTSARWLISGAACALAAIIVLVPFHAFLTVWLAQYLGHYTVLRLWKEVLLIGAGFVVLYVAVTRPEIRHKVLTSWLWRLAAAYLIVQVMWGIVALAMRQVTWAALGYGWITDTRFLACMFVAWVLALTVPNLQRRWRYLIFPSAAVVAGFGLLQYFVLPYDVLRHVGYGAGTIFPYEDINHNIHYIRIMSTLRGANPLGAYLLVISNLSLAVLLDIWRRHKVWRASRSWRYALASCSLLLMCLTALVLTFSRSAWVGAGFGVVVLVGLYVPQRARLYLLGASGVALGLVVIITAASWHNPVFQNIVLHTEEHSLIQSTSNAGHESALRSGLHDALTEPLGRGPGSAGPASVYNNGHPERIAENYFLQVVQETGWLGLVLLLGILVLLAQGLWRQRSSPLATGLLAALVGLVVVNFLSHAWSDDTLAYVWWGLAGIALVQPIKRSGKSVDDQAAAALA